MPARLDAPDRDPGPDKKKSADQPEESIENILAELAAVPDEVRDAQDRVVEGAISELSGAIHKYRALVEAVGDFNYDRAGIVIDPKKFGLQEDRQVTAEQLVKTLEKIPARLSTRVYSLNNLSRPDQAAKLQAIEKQANDIFDLINDRLIVPLQKKAERQGKKIENRDED